MKIQPKEVPNNATFLATSREWNGVSLLGNLELGHTELSSSKQTVGMYRDGHDVFVTKLVGTFNLTDSLVFYDL